MLREVCLFAMCEWRGCMVFGWRDRGGKRAIGHGVEKGEIVYRLPSPTNLKK